jgi:hypothetical protein
MDSSNSTLATLGQQIAELDAELRSAETARDQVDQQVKAAIASEDAESLSTAWAEKRRLAEHVADLLARQTETHRAWRAALDAEVNALAGQERDALEQVQTRQQQHVTELRGIVERAVTLLGDIDQLAGERLRVQEDARARLADVLAQAMPGNQDGNGRRVQASVSFVRGAPSLRAARELADHQRRSAAEKASAGPWKVYDPEAGKMVETLQELHRLLARWYPGKLTEHERLERFFEITDVRSLPEQLRQELRASGYPLREAGGMAVTEDVALDGPNPESVSAEEPG